jgi:hypothetical protein
MDIGKSQTVQKANNARLNKLSAMKPGLLMIVWRVGI